MKGQAEKSLTGDAASEKDAIFKTGHVTSRLKELSVQGGATVLASQVLQFTLRTLSLIILARLLSPDDFGLVAMATAVIGFANIVKDLGLSVSTVQKGEVNHEEVSTLFWVCTGVGLICTALVMALSPFIAWIYDDGELTWISVWLSLTLLWGAMSSQHQAILKRQMRFTAVACIDTGALAVGTTLGIGSALFGMGYWALVVMQVTTVAAGALGAWLAAGWTPGRPSRQLSVRSMISFGCNLTGYELVNYVARNIDNVLIGKYWGAASLGLYSRAYTLLLLPIQQINAPLATVVTPALSRLQSDGERFRRYYLKAVACVATITMPVVIFMTIMAGDIVTVMLGSQWSAAGEIFSILGIAALIQPVLHTSGWLHVSMGRTDRMLRWGVFMSAVTVTAIVVGIPYGTKGVATSYTVACYLLAPLNLWYATRVTSITLKDMAVTILPSVVLTALVGTALLLFRNFCPPLRPSANVCVGLAATLTSVFVCCLLKPQLYIPLDGFRSLLTRMTVPKPGQQTEVRPETGTSIQ